MTEDGYPKRLAAGEKAKQRYEQTGEVEYITGVDLAVADVAAAGAR